MQLGDIVERIIPKQQNQQVAARFNASAPGQE